MSSEKQRKVLEDIRRAQRVLKKGPSYSNGGLGSVTVPGTAVTAPPVIPALVMLLLVWQIFLRWFYFKNNLNICTIKFENACKFLQSIYINYWILVQAHAAGTDEKVSPGMRYANQTLQFANMTSFGSFVPQDSLFGNSIMPVLPRLEPPAPSPPAQAPVATTTTATGKHKLESTSISFYSAPSSNFGED